MAQFLFDGKKTYNLNNLPDEAWNRLSDNGNGGNATALYSSTAFLYAVIQRIANACSAVPLTLNGVPLDDKGSQEIKDSTNEGMGAKAVAKKAKQKPPVDFDIDVKDLLFRWSISLDLRGAGYARYESNKYGVIKRVFFCNPFTIYQEFNTETGETKYFRRMAQGASARQYVYPYDANSGLCTTHQISGQEYPGGLAWCWLPGLNENSHAMPPVEVARNPAAILAAIDQLSVNMFSRGVIKPFLVTAEGDPPPKEKRDELLSRLWRSLAGGLRTAFKVDVFPSSLKVQTVDTMNLAELAMSELDKANQEDICVIYNTPRPLVTGDAANKSVYEGQRHEWINNNIVPRVRSMIKALNFHIFEPLNMEGLAIHYEAIPANQEDEAGRANSVATLVSAGETLENAYKRFGYPELPKEEVPLLNSASDGGQELITVNNEQPTINGKSPDTAIPVNGQTNLQQQAFNGAQISSALQIITAYNEGVIERDNAVYMLGTFFQLDTDTANRLVPEKKGVVVDSPITANPKPIATVTNEPIKGNDIASIDNNVLATESSQDASKSSEIALLHKWTRNQYKAKGRVNLGGFSSNVLSEGEIASEIKGILRVCNFDESEWGGLKAIKLTLDDEETDAELQDWQEFLTNTSDKVVNGELSQSEYEKQFKDKLKVLLFLMFLRGAGVDTTLPKGMSLEDKLATLQGALSFDERTAYQRLFDEADLVADNEKYVVNLAKDLANGRYNEGGINPNNPTVIGGNPQQTTEAAKVNLANRLALWVNAAIGAFSAGQVNSLIKQRYMWEYGNTIDHCRTCLTLKDQVHTADEWKASGYRPQGRKLECKGYNCDCRLKRVDAKESSGSFMG